MSTKSGEGTKRRYRKRRRARQEEETRQRITEATVELHGSVGPARTTVSAVAERAGVQRGTVYRHFPDEQSLFDACSAHWLAENPPPDIGRWGEVDDPEERLRAALEELYAWFERNEPMLERTTRDAAVVEALRPSMEAFGQWLEAATDAVLGGRPARGTRRRLVRVAVAHALSFATWRSLAREQGLSRSAAIELMAGLARAAATPDGPGG